MKDFIKLSFCMLLMATAIILYSVFRCKFPDFNDPLGKFPFGGEQSKFASVLDGWSISHFLFFFLLGLLFPNQFYAAMTYGLMWEGLEYLTESTNLSLVDILRGVSTCKNNHTESGNHYFYSKSTDIIMNLTGFLMSSGLITILKSKQVNRFFK